MKLLYGKHDCEHLLFNLSILLLSWIQASRAKSDWMTILQKTCPQPIFRGISLYLNLFFSNQNILTLVQTLIAALVA